jgi:hypothetical protein
MEKGIDEKNLNRLMAKYNSAINTTIYRKYSGRAQANLDIASN